MDEELLTRLKALEAAQADFKKQLDEKNVEIEKLGSQVHQLTADLHTIDLETTSTEGANYTHGRKFGTMVNSRARKYFERQLDERDKHIEKVKNDMRQLKAHVDGTEQNAARCKDTNGTDVAISRRELDDVKQQLNSFSTTAKITATLAARKQADENVEMRREITAVGPRMKALEEKLPSLIARHDKLEDQIVRRTSRLEEKATMVENQLEGFANKDYIENQLHVFANKNHVQNITDWVEGELKTLFTSRNARDEESRRVDNRLSRNGRDLDTIFGRVDVLEWVDYRCRPTSAFC